MTKDNGFTLVEILAVITILGLIAILSSSAISSIIRGSRNDKESINIDTILNAAYDYVQNDPTLIPKAGEEKIICAMNLINCGLLKSEIIEDGQMKDPFEDHIIKITYVEDVSSMNDTKEDVKNYKYFGKYKFSYVENDGTCTGEENTCPYMDMGE